MGGRETEREGEREREAMINSNTAQASHTYMPPPRRFCRGRLLKGEVPSYSRNDSIRQVLKTVRIAPNVAVTSFFPVFPVIVG